MNVGKGTNKKGKKVAVPKANIQELNASRDGGQIASEATRINSCIRAI